MDPTTTFCPNLACPARGQTGQGNIGIHSRKDRRFICTPCRKTLLQRPGPSFTACARGATWGADPHVARPWLSGASHGGGLWVRRADGRGVEGTRWLPGQAVQEHLGEQPRDLGQVQADEIRVKRQGGMVWRALAMMVSTRLWLAGEVNEQRDRTLSRRLIERVRVCALQRPLWLCTDGLCSSIRARRETFRDPVRPGTHGCPRLRPWRNVCIAQVVKRYAQRRVIDVNAASWRHARAR